MKSVDRKAIQVQTSVASREEADRIATAVVERRLAACAQVIGPIASTYRWHGAVEQADEWLVVIKTRADAYDALETAIRELHSYETPEIIATPIVAGSHDYVQWIIESTTIPEPRE